MWEVLEPLAPELFWILCLAFVIAFLLAFSVGANDVSNSFGTSVGSRVLTVTQACILATFCEVAGATLLGYTVCDTFRRSVYDIEQYEGSQKELMLGALSCLIGSAAWNMIATALKMPISGTHSIVGATIGFSVVLRGWGSIKWMMILRIVASWFASPLISGIISSIIYVFISKTIIRKLEPLKYGLKALPLFYGATIFINVASVVISGPAVFGLDKLSWYSGLFISLVVAGVAICCVAMIMVPKLRRQISDELISYAKKPASKQFYQHEGQVKTTNLSKSGSADPTKSAFDNIAFKPDEPKAIEPAPDQAQQQSIDDVATKTEELSLDPKKLADPSKPPVAPKPAHLLERQQAITQAQESQLEEITLEPPTSGTTVAKKPDRQSKLRAAGKPYDAESGGGGGGNGQRPEMIRGERFEVFRLFSSLQILTACFASFAHGTNDVSNAVAPLIPIWNIYANGYENINQQTQIWILAFGGIGICTGLWAWGRAVMSTVGDGLTQLTPSKGFAIELGAAMSVLCASKLGLPISTTHCKVGSVVIVGLISSKFCSQDNLMDVSELEVREGQAIGGDQKEIADKSKGVVDWKLFGNIAITWIVTVPLAATASAAVMLLLRWVAL